MFSVIRLVLGTVSCLGARPAAVFQEHVLRSDLTVRMDPGLDPGAPVCRCQEECHVTQGPNGGITTSHDAPEPKNTFSHRLTL